MTAAPRRRWFRFGLRTMFVLVTLACVVGSWVVNQLDWIRERHEYLAGLKLVYMPNQPPNPIWSLRVLGERPIREIWITPSVGGMDRVRTGKELFPEADVIWLEQ